MKDHQNKDHQNEQQRLSPTVLTLRSTYGFNELVSHMSTCCQQGNNVKPTSLDISTLIRLPGDPLALPLDGNPNGSLTIQIIGIEFADVSGQHYKVKVCAAQELDAKLQPILALEKDDGSYDFIQDDHGIVQGTILELYIDTGLTGGFITKYSNNGQETILAIPDEMDGCLNRNMIPFNCRRQLNLGDLLGHPTADRPSNTLLGNTPRNDANTINAESKAADHSGIDAAEANLMNAARNAGIGVPDDMTAAGTPAPEFPFPNPNNHMQLAGASA